MPSLHTAYALMVFLSTRGSCVLFRIVVGVMASLVAIATLGLGEHYLIDLVLAFPLVTLFRAVSTTKTPFRSVERILAFIVPGFLLLVWGNIVRGALMPPHIIGFVVMAMIATVAVSLFLERRLAAIEDRCVPLFSNRIILSARSADDFLGEPLHWGLCVGMHSRKSCMRIQCIILKCGQIRSNRTHTTLDESRNRLVAP